MGLHDEAKLDQKFMAFAKLMNIHLNHFPKHEKYGLALDIRKFFYRIDRTILRTQIERKIKDARFVTLMMEFADHGEPVGIPIGNLLSQMYALIYLNPLDHFIKRTLGVKRYCRYVDDFVLFGLPRATLLCHKARIVAFIATLSLELSKFTLAPVSRGINFVGYRTWVSRRFIRRHSLAKFRHAIARGEREVAVSILGHARNTHSLGHLIKLTKEAFHDLPLSKAYR